MRLEAEGRMADAGRAAIDRAIGALIGDIALLQTIILRIDLLSQRIVGFNERQHGICHGGATGDDCQLLEKRTSWHIAMNVVVV